MIDFKFTEEQRAVRDTFRRLVEERILPRAAQIDAEGEFPAAEFRAVGDLGFFGMRYPKEVGGTAHDVVTYCLAVEELARGSLSVAAACTMQSLMGTYFLYRSGDATIHDEFLRPALAGERILRLPQQLGGAVGLSGRQQHDQPQPPRHARASFRAGPLRSPSSDSAASSSRARPANHWYCTL